MNQPPLNPDALAQAKAAAVDCRINGGSTEDVTECAVEAYLAVAQPVVNSVEELDALPPESYVQGWDGFKHAKTHSGDWVLCVEHTRGSHNSESIELPALVLYRPEVKP